MKTNKGRTWMTLGASVLTATALFRASADEQPAAPAAARADKSYTGTVTAVNPKEHVLSVKGWTMMDKDFNLGQNCSYFQLGENKAGATDLRVGEKVTVTYQDAHGILTASRITQEPMIFEGMVRVIDNDKHTLVLHRTALDKELQFPADCKITLRDGKPGTLSDIRVGNWVTATYEMPGDIPTARQITQTEIPPDPVATDGPNAVPPMTRN